MALSLSLSDEELDTSTHSYQLPDLYCQIAKWIRWSNLPSGIVISQSLSDLGFVLREQASQSKVDPDFISQICEKVQHGEVWPERFVPQNHDKIYKIVVVFLRDLGELFKVPKLRPRPHSDENNSLRKIELVTGFVLFILKFVQRRFTDNQVTKELKHLLAILWDAPFHATEVEDKHILLAQIEGVANEAGRLVNSVCFAPDPVFETMDAAIVLLSEHIDLLKANIINFSNSLLNIIVTPKTDCAVDSLVIVDSLLYDLEDIMNRDDNPTVVTDQMEMLHEGLKFSRSLLKDTEVPQHSENEELMKEPRMQLRAIAYEAEYLIKYFLAGDAPLWYFTIRLGHVNHKVELIGISFQVLNTCYDNGVSKLVAEDSSTQCSVQANRDFEVDDIMVGIEDQKLKIRDQLVGESKNLQIISISGMAGTGKTTLAKKLYNDPLVIGHFFRSLWCVVSQKYRRKDLLIDILISLDSEVDKADILEENDQTLALKIYQTLKGGRYLIVMDDIWNLKVWEDLHGCFPEDKNGSRILFTSRNKDVAPPHGIIHELPFLSNGQCWELLRRKVFRNKPCPTQLEELGKKMATNCNGLPLTVVVISGILSSMGTEESTWKNVTKSLDACIFSGGSNSVMQTVELSYKHLPQHLKPCFLYFGLFEEGEKIHVKRLMQLWIGAGLIRKDEKKRVETLAEEYLSDLIDKGLVMVAENRSNGRAKVCLVHDLLHEFCRMKAKEENFLDYGEVDCSIYTQRHHRLMYHASSEALQPYAPCIRSLFVTFDRSSILSVRYMKLLRALSCAGCRELDGIELLLNLRYLATDEMVSSMEHLVNLEFLIVRGDVCLSTLIMKMVKLRSLRAFGVHFNKHHNPPQTNNLEFLSAVKIWRANDVEMLKYSPHLRRLKCILSFEENEVRRPRLDLHFLTQLESLTVKASIHSKKRCDIAFPRNIKKLHLSGLMWTWPRLHQKWRSLSNLECLKLSDDAIEGGNVSLRWKAFPKLQQLVLRKCFRLRALPSTFGDIQTLQSIKVHGRCLESLAWSAVRTRKKVELARNDEIALYTGEAFTGGLDASKCFYPLPRVLREVAVWITKLHFPDRIAIPRSLSELYSVLNGVSSPLEVDPDVISKICDKVLRCEVWRDRYKPQNDDKMHEIVVGFLQDLKELFKVPKLQPLPRSDGNNAPRKNELVAGFMRSMLQFLSNYDDIADNQVLEELRHLLPILWDAPFQATEIEEVHNLLTQFEGLANQAGRLVHSFCFAPHPEFETMDEALARLSESIDLLKANISKSPPGGMIPPKADCAVDSLFIVDSLLHDLEDIMNQDDNPTLEVKSQMETLRQELKFSRSLLRDAEWPQHSYTEELMKEPRMQLRDEAYEAEYLIKYFLAGDVPLWYFTIRLSHVIRNVEQIGIRLQNLKNNDNWGSKVGEDSGTRFSLQANRNFEVDDFVIGFEDIKLKILEQLVGGMKKLQIVSICGMAGIGKTTLAKKFYNDPGVGRHFDRKLWCVVSQNYERKHLLSIILSRLDGKVEGDKSSKMNEQQLALKIYQSLKDRRYLIVMDDIWNLKVWADFNACFPEDKNGSRILFTSRIKDVAPREAIINVPPVLTNDQCWELLQNKVFCGKRCPTQLEGIGKKIATNCKGLPLAVVVIAGILQSMDKEKGIWKNVAENLGSYIHSGQSNSVMQILQLSYKHLPQRLKPCFLYFAFYREDAEINVNELIRLWIAEGFIPKNEKTRAEMVAEQYFSELTNRSLVSVAQKRSDGRAKFCVLHDLLHNLCRMNAKEENFIKFDNGYSASYERCHRLRLCGSGYNMKPNGPRVRSLVAPGFYLLCVHEMKLLRILDCQDQNLDGIELPVNLRCLTVNRKVPSIERLVNLEFLITRRLTLGITTLVQNLVKLRYLRADYIKFYGDCNSSRTNKLEYLSGIKIRGVNGVEMLKYSPNLRRLKCSIYEGEEETACYDLRFLNQLESLTVLSSIRGELLCDIKFPSNIKKLHLDNLSWPWEKMSAIGSLPNLEVLKLEDNAFKGDIWNTSDDEFKQLKFLKLEYLDELAQWNVPSTEHFPKLQQLDLNSCRRLEGIPSEIGYIDTLQSIKVGGVCLESLVQSARQIRLEQEDMGNDKPAVDIQHDHIESRSSRIRRLRECSSREELSGNRFIPEHSSGEESCNGIF